MRNIGLRAERSLVLVFETGDSFTDDLMEFARANNIKSGFFYGLGAFERVTVAYFDLAKKVYEHIEIDEQVELISLVGNISIYNDKPKIHSHAVVGKRDGSALGGHLIEGKIRPTLELYLTMSETELTRRLDRATNLPLLDLTR